MMPEPVAMAISFLFDCIPLCYIKALPALTHKQARSRNYYICLAIKNYFGEISLGPLTAGSHLAKEIVVQCYRRR